MAEKKTATERKNNDSVPVSSNVPLDLNLNTLYKEALNYLKDKRERSSAWKQSCISKIEEQLDRSDISDEHRVRLLEAFSQSHLDPSYVRFDGDHATVIAIFVGVGILYAVSKIQMKK